MTVEIQIRHEETQDIEQIQQILLSAFPTEAESKLVDALQANGKGIISLVASKRDEVLGHILFSPVTTTPPRDWGLPLSQFVPMCNFRALGQDSSAKDCRYAESLAVIIVLCWATLIIINVLGLRRQVVLVYETNMAWMRNSWFYVFLIAPWPASFSLRLNLAGFLFEYYIKINNCILLAMRKITGGFHDRILQLR